MTIKRTNKNGAGGTFVQEDELGGMSAVVRWDGVGRRREKVTKMGHACMYVRGWVGMYPGGCGGGNQESKSKIELEGGCRKS